MNRAFPISVAAATAALVSMHLTPSQEQPDKILIRGGIVVDGTGALARTSDVRIEGNKIISVGRLSPRAEERVLDATGLIVAPGFIDAHSHADRGMASEPLLESQVRQGITTAIVGQDGGGMPTAQFFDSVRRARPALNFATFSGHGRLREEAMGGDYKRRASADEIAKMAGKLEWDMFNGALGLSSGLEYDPGFYSDTEELIALAKVAGNRGGMYISHVRDEGNGAMDSFRELIHIAREARLPAQISHIKLATSSVWGRANEVIALVEAARREGLDITADVYPYLYWQSTITVLTLDRNWDDPKVWEKALAEVGGPRNILLSNYTPDPSWQGKTLAELAEQTGKDAIWVIQEIIRKTHGPNATGSESIVCTAMTDEDLSAFIGWKRAMICSDGSHGGSHPRGAGAFPRVLTSYAFSARVVGNRPGSFTKRILSLCEAIRKMTSFPADRFRLKDRGRVAPGCAADIVVFDPARIVDRATPQDPRAFSKGVVHVLVNGIPVLEDGKMTEQRPGLGLRRK